VRFVATWITLAAFWVLLSGYFDAVHLLFGLVAVTLVSLLSSHHLAAGSSVGRETKQLVRLVLYAPWLLGQVAIANVDVLLRVLGFRRVEPVVVRFRPELESEFGRVTLANSITLTPGTVTVEVEEDGSFIVHAISPEAAKGLLDGNMVAHVRRVEGSGA
jgi:multicomponent Na+:H+ antiporter subunit E